MIWFKKSLIRILIVIGFGIIPAMFCQVLVRKPVDRYIHVKSFRYGKDPSVIRCNRGDRIHLTFSTNDTGHSFFLEEFDMDVKVSPARKEVEVFKVSDPTSASLVTREFAFTARHRGLNNVLISKSNYRCHVWCGPMHAFEQGKLIIFPNTLLWFSIGCCLGIIFLWVRSFFRGSENSYIEKGESILLKPSKLFNNLLVSRWPQASFTLFAMMMIYLVILTCIFGTQMSGRNLGVLLMWAIWLFVLVALLTPLLGRVWCTICPLPLIGDMFQRNSFFSPIPGKTKGYNNKFSGFFLKWPQFLRNDWLRLMVFLLLATFSTTLVAQPRVSGITVLMLLLVPTVMSLIFELRAFCRYVCPVSVFVGSFSRMSPIGIRSKIPNVCSRCKSHFCQNGSEKGWACPYGLTVANIHENTDCGLCLECTRSCLYNNVAVVKRGFATETGTRRYSEAWLTLSIFTLAFVYSVLYEGHWPVVRDFVNILDKENWQLFGIYALIVWSLALVIVPSIIYGLAVAGKKLSRVEVSSNSIFLTAAGALLPLGLMLWIAFVVPMLFVNVTFIIQSFSDPFGWGWDFFGTANIPWHQFIPHYIPAIQSALVLTGLYFSLRNLKRSWMSLNLTPATLFRMSFPLGTFIISVVIVMIFFFTN